jgi:hypothetical protein
MEMPPRPRVVDNEEAVLSGLRMTDYCRQKLWVGGIALLQIIPEEKAVSPCWVRRRSLGSSAFLGPITIIISADIHFNR